MAGFFLTTVALKITLIWDISPLATYVRDTPPAECWVSPLSHAILKDEFFVRDGMSIQTARIGLEAVNEHLRGMSRFTTQYPYPDARSMQIWAEIRSLDIRIPAYQDAFASFPEHTVGPDEALVYACAAANVKPLLGPGPTDKATVSLLQKRGVHFLPQSEWLNGDG